MPATGVRHLSARVRAQHFGCDLLVRNKSVGPAGPPRGGMARGCEGQEAGLPLPHRRSGDGMRRADNEAGDSSWRLLGAWRCQVPGSLPSVHCPI